VNVEAQELPNGGVRLIFSDFTEEEDAIIAAGAAKFRITKARFLKRVLLSKAREEVAKLKGGTKHGKTKSG
jgi:hypothetical protein